MEVAIEMTGVDGERSDEETELLSLLTHKLLAKALVSGRNQASTQNENTMLSS